eukprot:CAMPEP_0119499680 /NCGR_PEP_ID=MMETSP1344-20130328/22065_1 /TAXON_ID=236787 /ORGANISM="Florenciella parvula, Strain CCMP2471" /LENGTH=75 /DNA_ID=CAMNT_0007535695 /DNA_START=31 /DNA_END=258 /DNA_ORIENTATION=+
MIDDDGLEAAAALRLYLRQHVREVAVQQRNMVKVLVDQRLGELFSRRVVQTCGGTIRLAEDEAPPQAGGIELHAG